MKRFALVVSAAALSMTGSAFAAQATTTLPVSALVVDVCAVAALPMAFGTYDPTSSSNLDSTATVTVTCSLNTPYNVRMSAGANSASVSTRKMLVGGGGSDLLPYALYRDSGRTQNWGVTDGTDTVAGTGAGLPQAITVYGRVAGSQNVPAGAFTDTVTVTVNY
jgi:spore coat protein U-like protein